MRPDYSAIHNALLAVMKRYHNIDNEIAIMINYLRYKVKFDDHYDWEKDSDLKVVSK